MPEANPDLAKQVAATANRLRQIQADFADDSPQAREEYLSEEVQKALSKLLPDQRKPFLEALREQFPSWDANVLAADQPAEKRESSLQSPTDQREWNDASFVLERLVTLAQALPADKKRQLIDRLSEAGLSAAGHMAVADKTLQELKTNLRLEAGQSVQSERVAELATRLVLFSNSLDQLAWKIWKMIAPKSNLRSTGLQNTMHRFVKGDADVPLTRDLEQLRHLVASMLSAISQIGKQFGQHHLAKFAPAEIEAAAAMEPGGFLVAKEVKCWRKYVELAKTLDDTASIDRQIMQIIADFVGSMPGMGA